MSGSLKHRQAGLTLIELLVATLLLAVLGVMAYRGLSAVQGAQQHLSVTADRWQAISHAVDRLGRDLQQATATPGRAADGRLAPALTAQAVAVDATEQPQITLTRAGNEDMSARRQAFRWRKNTLELLLWPTPESTADLSTVKVYPLLPGVSSFELAYLDDSSRWLAFWPVPGGPTLPRAIRLRMMLEEGWAIERLFDLP
jgi:general secretion pathway protein J